MLYRFCLFTVDLLNVLYGTCTTLQVTSSRFQLQGDVFVGGIWILIVYLRGKSNQVAVVSKMQFLTRCKQKQTMLIDSICILAVYLRGKSNQVAGSSATFGEKVIKLLGGEYQNCMKNLQLRVSYLNPMCS